MSIEIRQLHIKSNVVQRCESGAMDDVDAAEKQMEMKDDILAQCKEMILDILRQRGER